MLTLDAGSRDTRAAMTSTGRSAGRGRTQCGTPSPRRTASVLAHDGHLPGVVTINDPLRRSCTDSDKRVPFSSRFSPACAGKALIQNQTSLLTLLAEVVRAPAEPPRPAVADRD